MANYATTHQRALAKVKAAGAIAVFTLTGQGALNDATDRVTPGTDVVVTGYAIEEKPNYAQYQALGLVVSKARTLFWVPVTFGDEPAMSSRIPWNGRTYAIKNVAPLAPGGKTISATIVVSE